jgi:transcriptional regulator CtsR
MARLSDVIETFLKEMIMKTEGTIEIQRNELASYFKCVPSQINYVLDTRFTNDRGYYVESRRGGGGSIKIRMVSINQPGNYLMHIISGMGDSITSQSVGIFINNFVDYTVISPRDALIIKAATSDKALMLIEPDKRDNVRAAILKSMLLALIT